MDPFVAGPDWGHYIVAYFYFGGIAAGAYTVAALVNLWGDEADRRVVRVANYVAFPLACLCGLLLVVDLGRPERFWHMMVQSETYRPMFKWWSPMSAGSWGLSAFGLFSACSFVGALAEDRRLGLKRRHAARAGDLARKLRRGPFGRVFQTGAALSGLFVGSYTGALLSASNQPVWADTPWLAALFLASALSTGVAAMILLARWRLHRPPHEVVGRLERVDAWAAVMELCLLVAFAVSLGPVARPAFGRWPGVLIPALVVPVGVVVPLLSRLPRGDRPRWEVVSAVCVLAAGLVLRFAVIGAPGPLLLGPIGSTSS